MKLRIIIIDDEESIRESLKLFLEFEGHEVIIAASPLVFEDQCDHLSHYCCDLILSDYNMPGMTGLDYFRLLNDRGCKLEPECKYIMSGNTNIIDMEEAKQIGCRVLQKPLTLDHVSLIVKEVVERRTCQLIKSYKDSGGKSDLFN